MFHWLWPDWIDWPRREALRNTAHHVKFIDGLDCSELVNLRIYLNKFSLLFGQLLEVEALHQSLAS